MLPPIHFLLILLLAGASAAALLAPRLERIEAAHLARGYLIGVAALTGRRVLAYVVANVFGVQGIRSLSTAPWLR